MNSKAVNDSSHIKIAVITCSPGDELYSIFGHTALRIKDSTAGTDIIYNYGTFDFDDPDFYSKFVRGKLEYFLSAENANQFFNTYLSENRSVFEQELNLSIEEKTTIIAFIQNNIKGSNKFYFYDFLYNNCTSKIRDILIQHTSFKPQILLVKNETTFRNMLHEYLDMGHQPWSKFGIDILLGSKIDIPVDKTTDMFLPDYLMKGIDTMKNNKNVLVKKITIVNSVATTVEKENNNKPLILFSAICLVLFLVSLSENKIAQRITVYSSSLFLYLTGLLGVLLLFMWFGTNHKACAANYNLLWALPTHLLAAMVCWKPYKWLKNYYKFSSLLHGATIVLWFFLPQHFNIALMPIVMLLCWQTFQLSRK